MPDDVSIARALHVLGVVLWIGGVALVTMVLLPAVRRMKTPEERVAFFEDIEGRFAAVARWATVLVGLSGLYIIYVWDMWYRFLVPSNFWMHLMVLVWVVFTVMLFIAEPLFLHRWFQERAKTHPEQTFRIIQRMHWVLLSISLITVAAATAGSHGGFSF